MKKMKMKNRKKVKRKPRNLRLLRQLMRVIS